MQFILKTRQKTAKNSKMFNFLFCHDIPQSNIRNKFSFTVTLQSFAVFYLFGNPKVIKPQMQSKEEKNFIKIA